MPNVDRARIFPVPGPSHEVIAVCRALSRGRPGIHALDLGAGGGRNSLFLAAEGCRVTAVDSSAVRIRELRGAAARSGLGINCVQTDVRATPGRGTVDMALMLGVLHYLSSSEAAGLVREMQSRTAPGGVHLITRAERPPEDPDGSSPAGSAEMTRIDDAELLSLYADWRCLAYERYRKSDFHPGHGTHTLSVSKMVFRAPSSAGSEVIGVPHILVDREFDRHAETILAEANLMTVTRDSLLGHLGRPDHLVEHSVELPRRELGHSLRLLVWGKHVAYVENGLLAGIARFTSSAFHTYSSTADR
jgi:tellurite methyltransferase